MQSEHDLASSRRPSSQLHVELCANKSRLNVAEGRVKFKLGHEHVAFGSDQGAVRPMARRSCGGRVQLTKNMLTTCPRNPLLNGSTDSCRRYKCAPEQTQNLC